MNIEVWMAFLMFLGFFNVSCDTFRLLRPGQACLAPQAGFGTLELAIKCQHSQRLASCARTHL